MSWMPSLRTSGRTERGLSRADEPEVELFAVEVCARNLHLCLTLVLVYPDIQAELRDAGDGA